MWTVMRNCKNSSKGHCVNNYKKWQKYPSTTRKKKEEREREEKENIWPAWEVILKTVLKHSFWKQFTRIVFGVFKNKIAFDNWICS